MRIACTSFNNIKNSMYFFQESTKAYCRIKPFCKLTCRWPCLLQLGSSSTCARSPLGSRPRVPGWPLGNVDDTEPRRPAEAPPQTLRPKSENKNNRKSQLKAVTAI